MKISEVLSGGPSFKRVKKYTRVMNILEFISEYAEGEILNFLCELIEITTT
jgi:hypothetical protein